MRKMSEREAWLWLAKKWKAATCETTHCRGGWAIRLAGESGTKLEEAVGSYQAARLIYYASTGYVPNFYADDEDAMADIVAKAKGK